MTLANNAPARRYRSIDVDECAGSPAHPAATGSEKLAEVVQLNYGETFRAKRLENLDRGCPSQRVVPPPPKAPAREALPHLAG